MIFYKSVRSQRVALGASMCRACVSEYRFLVDFKGAMHFDDQQVHLNPRNQIKDRKFIEKFYQCLCDNHDELAHKYTHVAEFWGERNYLRSAISPVLFTALHQGKLQFSLGLTTPFHPKSLRLDKQGRFCHPYASAHTTITGIFSNALSATLLPKVREREGRLWLGLEEQEVVLGEE